MPGLMKLTIVSKNINCLIQNRMEQVFLPISIRITEKKIVLIGGGKVAMEKITSLKRFTSNITIISKDIDSAIQKLPYTIIKKLYEKSDLRGFFLVYACTDNAGINEQIRNDCNDLGILINVVDNPGLCDFISPAIYKKEYMTVAVSSAGKEVRRSIELRNRIGGFLNGAT